MQGVLASCWQPGWWGPQFVARISFRRVLWEGQSENSSGLMRANTASADLSESVSSSLITRRAEALSRVLQGEGGALEIPSDSPAVLTQREGSRLRSPPQGTRCRGGSSHSSSGRA